MHGEVLGDLCNSLKHVGGLLGSSLGVGKAMRGEVGRSLENDGVFPVPLVATSVFEDWRKAKKISVDVGARCRAYCDVVLSLLNFLYAGRRPDLSNGEVVAHRRVQLVQLNVVYEFLSEGVPWPTNGEIKSYLRCCSSYEQDNGHVLPFGQ